MPPSDPFWPDPTKTRAEEVAQEFRVLLWQHANSVTKCEGSSVVTDQHVNQGAKAILRGLAPGLKLLVFTSLLEYGGAGLSGAGATIVLSDAGPHRLPASVGVTFALAGFLMFAASKVFISLRR